MSVGFEYAGKGLFGGFGLSGRLSSLSNIESVDVPSSMIPHLSSVGDFVSSHFSTLLSSPSDGSGETFPLVQVCLAVSMCSISQKGSIAFIL